MIQVEIDDQILVEQLRKLQRGVVRRQRLMKALSGTLKTAVDKNFAQGGRPKWQGLKYRNGVPLVNTGHLKNSIQSVYDNDVAQAGTNVVYAGIHQFGGKAGRNRQVTIPARPFLRLTAEDEGDLVTDIQRYLQGLLQ
ncbi:phage virion morphogenesis protein [Lonepinella sp. BR2474]|uniref:phage virion morphogenesis protein n=1 Tax=Lonepinella sp. BR2474 TaxID=3434548 RepID=UPI003F6E1441